MSRSLDDENDDPIPEQRRRFAMFSKMMREGRSFSGNERNCCFLNTGAFPAAKGRFANISAVSGIDYPDDGRALTVVDWDQDGDLDLWISNRNAPRLRFLRNESQVQNHFLRLRLVGNGTTTNRDAIGARVEVLLANPQPEIGNPKSIETLRAGEGLLSQNSKWLHFGLAAGTDVEKVVVDWPGGTVEEFRDVAVDQHHLLVQGTGAARTYVRESRELAIVLGDQPVPVPPDSSQLRLVTPIELPPISYVSDQGNVQPLRSASDRLLLVNLWASWCEPCLKELQEFTDSEAALRAAGVDILALSVEGLATDATNPGRSHEILKAMAFPFRSGQATEMMMNGLQGMHDQFTPVARPLPLPTSLLIDERGRFAVIYRGPVRVDEVLEDVKLTNLDRGQRFRKTAAMDGRVIQHPVAIEALKRAEADQRLKMAQTYRQSGNFAQAVTQYDQSIDLWSDQKTGSSDVSPSLDGSEAISQAGDRLGRAPEIIVVAYENRAQLYEQARRPDLALNDFSEVIKLKPDDAIVYNSRGNIYQKLGQFELALKDYAKAIHLDPEFEKSYYNRGNLYLKTRKLDLAIADYTRAVELKSDYVMAINNRGNAYLGLGKMESAKEDYTKAIRLKPDFAAALNNRAYIHEQSNNLEHAIFDYSKAIALNPRDPVAHRNRGRTYRAFGQYERAVKDFERAVELDVNSPLSHRSLAWLLATCPNAKIRDGKRAVPIATRACELTNWQQKATLETLAAAYAEIGKFDDAVRWQKRAIELAGDADKSELEQRLELYGAQTPYREDETR